MNRERVIRMQNNPITKILTILISEWWYCRKDLMFCFCLSMFSKLYIKNMFYFQECKRFFKYKNVLTPQTMVPEYF